MCFIPILSVQCSVPAPGGSDKPRCSDWQKHYPETYVQISELNLRYDLTNSYIDASSLNELHWVHGMHLTGSLNHLQQLFPDEFTLSEYTGDNRPQYKVEIKLTDCYGSVTYDYGKMNRTDVIFNDVVFDFFRIPDLEKRHFASFLATAKTIKTTGNTPTRVVWEIGMNDFDPDDIKYDSDGKISETKTKLYVDVDGLVTTTDNRDIIYGRGGSGHDLTHDIDIDNIVPDGPSQPYTPDDQTAIVPIDNSSFKFEGTAMEAVVPIDNSSFIFEGTAMEAADMSETTVVFTGELAPVSKDLMKEV